LTQVSLDRALSLGGPKLPEARVIGHAVKKANADKHAGNALPIIREVGSLARPHCETFPMP
jgi:hypothetical protein